MVVPYDLHRMQLDVLSVLAERSHTGAGVVRELNDQYDKPPHRSTVYHHLGTLVEHGLVEEQDDGGDDRAKDFYITPEGEEVIRQYAADLTVRVQTGELTRR